MSDADLAQQNAMKSIFGNELVSCMCLFHVMYNVKKRIKGFSPEVQKLIKKDIKSMHYTRNVEEFTEKK
jgi:hypothetical protein